MILNTILSTTISDQLDAFWNMKINFCDMYTLQDLENSNQGVKSTDEGWEQEKKNEMSNVYCLTTHQNLLDHGGPDNQ